VHYLPPVLVFLKNLAIAFSNMATTFGFSMIVGTTSYGRHLLYMDKYRWVHKIEYVMPSFTYFQVNFRTNTVTMSETNVKLTKTQRAVITQDIDELETQRLAAGKIAQQWEEDIYENYNGHGTDAIMNMLSYHQNIRNGFGKCNDENNYTEKCNKDKDGMWLREAQRGVELYMVCSGFTKLISEKKRERGDYAKYSRIKH
jgi:hypothetical protein